jgi:hypothetical protein
MKLLAGIIGIAVLVASIAGGVFWTKRSAGYPVTKASSFGKQELYPIDAGFREMRDSCIPSYPVGFPTLRLTPC